MSGILETIKKKWEKRKRSQAWKHGLDMQCGFSSCPICYRPYEEAGEDRKEINPTFDYSILTDPREED